MPSPDEIRYRYVMGYFFGSLLVQLRLEAKHAGGWRHDMYKHATVNFTDKTLSKMQDKAIKRQTLVWTLFSFQKVKAGHVKPVSRDAKCF